MHPDDVHDRHLSVQFVQATTVDVVAAADTYWRLSQPGAEDTHVLELTIKYELLQVLHVCRPDALHVAQFGSGPTQPLASLHKEDSATNNYCR